MDKKYPNVYLYTGVKVDMKVSDGLWRAKVLGNNYCSQTFEGLVEAIGFFHSIYTSFDEAKILPDRVLTDTGILSGNSSLEERQSALRRLEANTSPAARDAVAKVRQKHTSFGAEYITRCVGKRDFSEVKPQEIFDLVANILHREELIRELAERVKI